MRHSWSISIFAIACTLLVNATPARAAPETWVSGTGTDAGTCPITAPCRTFAHAHNVTNNNGTLNVLSSGNFGPLTITKSISIVAEGVEAVISSAAGGAAIKIQAPADRIVSLRGLTIDLLGRPNHGISFVSGAALHVKQSAIRRSSIGIEFEPSETSELYVADSVIADSGSGIFVGPSGSGGATVLLDRVRVENSSVEGIRFSGTNTTGSITASVRDSVSAGSGSSFGFGILAFESGEGATSVMIDRSAVVNNKGTGIRTIGATIRIGDSTVTGNNVGLSTSGAAGSVIASYRTNKVNGNNSDGVMPSPIDMK